MITNKLIIQIENIISQNTFIYEKYYDTYYTEYSFRYNTEIYPPIIIINNIICKFPSLHKEFNIIKNSYKLKSIFNAYFKDKVQFNKLLNEINE